MELRNKVTQEYQDYDCLSRSWPSMITKPYKTQPRTAPLHSFKLSYYNSIIQIVFEQYDVAEGAVSKAVEVVPIPLHPIIQFSFMFIVY